MFWKQGCGRWSLLSLFLAFLLTALTFRWSPKITDLFAQWHDFTQKIQSAFLSFVEWNMTTLVHANSHIIDHNVNKPLSGCFPVTLNTSQILNLWEEKGRRRTALVGWFLTSYCNKGFYHRWWFPFGFVCYLPLQGKSDWCIVILGEYWNQCRTFSANFILKKLQWPPTVKQRSTQYLPTKKEAGEKPSFLTLSGRKVSAPTFFAGKLHSTHYIMR